MGRRAVVALAVLVAATALAPSAGARLVPAGATVKGMTYPQWLVAWSQQASKRSILSRNSLLAVRGNRCGLTYGGAWLLPTSVNGLIDVSCTIPRGLPIVVLVAGGVATADDPAGLVASQTAGFATLKRAELTVDGRALRPHLVTTPVFLIDLPLGNVFGYPPGTVDALGKGYLAIFSPPSPGAHTITTSGVFTNPDRELGMTFHLTIR